MCHGGVVSHDTCDTCPSRQAIHHHTVSDVHITGDSCSTGCPSSWGGCGSGLRVPMFSLALFLHHTRAGVVYCGQMDGFLIIKCKGRHMGTVQDASIHIRTHQCMPAHIRLHQYSSAHIETDPYLLLHRWTSIRDSTHHYNVACPS